MNKEIAKGRLEVIAPNEITELLVLDKGFREVMHGTSRLRAELIPGIYRVQARLPGARSEQLVAVEPGQTVTVTDFELEFDSPAPLVGIPSTHEYQRYAAEEQSRKLHAVLGEKPDSGLFLFARSTSSRFFVPTFVVQGQGLEVRFPEFGEYRLGDGWLALNLALPAGTYFVEQDVPALGKRGQVLFAEEGWQTQVFAPWEEIPDFSKAVIHMRRAFTGYLHFHPHDPTQTALDKTTEAALEGLSRGRFVMSRADLQRFLDAKFDDPIMGLVGAYAMVVTDTSEFDDRLRNVIVPNLQRLLPHSPDVALLSLLVGSSDMALQSVKSQVTFTEPPLFAIGTERLLELTANAAVTCPADSWLADIALRLTTGSVWTRCDESISVAEAREQLRSALLDRLPHGRFSDLRESAARLARELGLPLSVVDREISYLNELKWGTDVMSNGQSSNNTQRIAIQFEIVPEDASDADLALVYAVGRDAVNGLHNDGYAVQPVYTGRRGGPLFEIIATIAANIWAQKDITLADASALATIFNAVIPIAKHILKAGEKRPVSDNTQKPPIKITIEIDDVPISVEAPDLESVEDALKLAKRFQASHPSVASKVTLQSKVKVTGHVRKNQPRRRR